MLIWMLPIHPHKQMHSFDTDTSVPSTQLFSDKKGHGKVRVKKRKSAIYLS